MCWGAEPPIPPTVRLVADPAWFRGFGAWGPFLRASELLLAVRVPPGTGSATPRPPAVGGGPALGRRPVLWDSRVSSERFGSGQRGGMPPRWSDGSSFGGRGRAQWLHPLRGACPLASVSLLRSGCCPAGGCVLAWGDAVPVGLVGSSGGAGRPSGCGVPSTPLWRVRGGAGLVMSRCWSRGPAGWSGGVAGLLECVGRAH